MDVNNLKKVISLRHDLHKHAELSGEEIWTKNRLIKFLKENTSLSICDRGKWFYAYYHNDIKSKNIAFVEDFDAISMDEGINLYYGSINKGVAHKCGHDGHAATLAGLCLEINRIGSDKNIYFVFQHGEETGVGAREASCIITEKNISEIYKMHSANYHTTKGFPEKSIVYTRGINNCASTGLIINFLGKDSHASLPEDGINPSFAIGKLISHIEKRNNLDANKLLLATVVEVKIGDKNFGKSPGRGVISLTVRASREDSLNKFIHEILNLANDLSTEYKLGINYQFRDYFPEVFNHDTSIDKIKKASNNLNLELIETTTARSSEDFGYYTKLTQGAYFMVGNGEGYPQAHTCEFDYNDNIIETSVEMFKEIIKL